jgi:hypothetical protein
VLFTVSPKFRAAMAEILMGQQLRPVWILQRPYWSGPM